MDGAARRRRSGQDAEGVGQQLQLVLHALQASLDLQGVVQHLDAGGVRVKPDREGSFDTSHVPPSERCGRGQTHKKHFKGKKMLGV